MDSAKSLLLAVISIATTASGVYHSCKDIYVHDLQSQSGTYTIMNRRQESYVVYCEFHQGYGYTFISNTTTVPINIDDLYTTNEHAMVRILKTNGQEKEVKLEQTTRYQSQKNLTFFYNNNNGFAAPLNAKLAPYIYVGFLPTSIAQNRNTQGYRANGVNYEFQNCDSAPNSYLVFYFNPHNLPPVGYYPRCCDTGLMHQWVNHAVDVPNGRKLPPHFYYFFEMHMGGCGGYAIPQEYHDVVGATVGFRFDYNDPCTRFPCLNNGTCYSQGTTFDCECRTGFSGSQCQFRDSILG